MTCINTQRTAFHCSLPLLMLIFIIPIANKVKWYKGITMSVCLSVCLSNCADSCPGLNFYLLWHLAHGSFTMRQCVSWFHDADPTLTFEVKVTFIGFWTWLRVRTTFFVLWYSHTMTDTYMYHFEMICHINSWPLYDLEHCHQNTIFHLKLVSGQGRICSWTYAYQIWHMTSAGIQICGWRGKLTEFYLFYCSPIVTSLIFLNRTE